MIRIGISSARRSAAVPLTLPSPSRSCGREKAVVQTRFVAGQRGSNANLAFTKLTSPVSQFFTSPGRRYPSMRESDTPPSPPADAFKVASQNERRLTASLRTFVRTGRKTANTTRTATTRIVWKTACRPLAAPPITPLAVAPRAWRFARLTLRVDAGEIENDTIAGANRTSPSISLLASAA
eukprot:scaffold442_cov397-Prasinococcus_capsulatus_cf.AAC.59